MDSNLVDLMKDMPPWIQWVTLNSCFEHVESALDKLCECLQRRDAVQAGLPGLAIINSGLRSSNIEPLVKFLKYASKPPPASPAHSKVKSVSTSVPRIPRGSLPGLFRGLKWLDLSGNRLGDGGVAKVSMD